jgi:hypothetical protein
MFRIRFLVVFAVVAIFIVASFGCARIVNMPMKVRSAGVLESEDYRQLEIAANQSPARVGERLGTSCVPTMAYFVNDDYDFSQAKSIHIADFKFTDQRVDDKVTKDTPDHLALLLSEKHIFEHIERLDSAAADVALHVFITRYQDITAGQTAKVVLTGGVRCGFFLMEAKIVNAKTNLTIGAVQVNHITTRTGLFLGGIMAWSGSRRPEGQIPDFLLKVFQGIKAGQTNGTSSIAFDCMKDDGTNLIDKICQ